MEPWEYTDSFVAALIRYEKDLNRYGFSLEESDEKYIKLRKYVWSVDRFLKMGMAIERPKELSEPMNYHDLIKNLARMFRLKNHGHPYSGAPEVRPIRIDEEIPSGFTLLYNNKTYPVAYKWVVESESHYNNSEDLIND